MSTSPEQRSDGAAPQSPPPKPKGVWGMILTVTPVVMTVLATVFAGMSSSEMTQSMMSRSLATQQQSKAGDQWSLFQAKRIRGTTIEMTQKSLHHQFHPESFDAGRLEPLAAQMQQMAEQANDKEVAAKLGKAREKLAKLLGDEKFKQNLAYISGTGLPDSDTQSLANKDALRVLDEVLAAVRQRKSEHETLDNVRRLPFAEIEEATRLAEQNADNFDKAGGPVGAAARSLQSVFKDLDAALLPVRKNAGQKGDNSPQGQLIAFFDNLDKSFDLALLEFDGRRYRKEASFNQVVAEMYEVQVRRSGAEADRHRERSRRFFYSMLVAQAGVTVASLALAKAQRSGLWLVAALAGLAALSFSGYVYFVF